jgi:16S rRNA (adenine1518-N6/adenine1519-N6)-dimethyltransferase
MNIYKKYEFRKVFIVEKLTSPGVTRTVLAQFGIRARKKYGQNFLTDGNIVRGIVEAAGITKEDCVLEIGPGLGVLTEEMLRRGARVTAVEKDPVLAGRLKPALGEHPDLDVIAGDALKVRVEKRFGCMVSNLPYQAGTRILLELVQRRELPVITVLVQTEVAERLAAKEGSKVRGLAGVWAQLDYDVKLIRKVSASCFWPRPEVGSSVVKLVRHDRNVDFSPECRKLFHSLTKKAFEHRRKQLGSVFKDLIQSTARADVLSNEDWITLVKGLINENA